MKIIFKYLLFILILTNFSNLSSQTQNFIIKRYTVDNGLPDNRVNDIVQDSTGKIWIAMRTGIAVYDGINWRKFTEKDGVPEAEYTKIKIDEKGVIWFLPTWSNHPLISYKNTKWQNINFVIEEKTISEHLNSLDIIYEGTVPSIYIGLVSGGVFKFEDNQLNRISIKNGLLSDSTSNLLINSNKIYVTSIKGLSIIDGDNIFNYDFSNYKIDPNILTIRKVDFDSKQKNKILLLSKNWIGEFEKGKLKIIKKDFHVPILGINNVNIIGYHPSGDIFFGNVFVIYSYNIFTKEFKKLFTETPLPNRGATSILVDYEGNIWLTSLRGIYKFQYAPFQNYFVRDGLLENEVTAIEEFNSGDLVIGHNFGLSIKTRMGFKHLFDFSADRTSKISRILDFYHDKENDVIYFCSLNNGVGRLDKTGRIIWYKTPLAKRYYSIFPKNKGNLIVSTNLGFFSINNDKLSLLTLRVPEMVRKGILVDDSTTYFVSSDGLYSWTAEKLKNYHYPDKELNNFFSVFFNKKVGLLVGSDLGLFCIKNDSLARYKLNGEEINESVYFITEDHSDNLWIGTNNGVLKWDGKTHTRYNKKDGLAGNETNRAAGFVDSKGNLWIGTDEGLSMYTGSKFDYTYLKPKIVIKDVEDEQNKKHNPFSNFTLEPENNTIIFNYRLLSFIDETQNVYQIKLSQADGEWEEEFLTDYSYSRFNNLKDGNYIFSVRAKNAKGIWSDWQHSGVITISKHFYEQPLFIGGISLIFILVFYFIFDNRQQKKYNKKLKEVVDTRTRQLKDKQTELVTSLERYRGIVDSQTDLLVRVDSDNKFTFVNDAFCRVFGKTREQLIGESFLPLVHPDDRNNSIEEMQKLSLSPHRIKLEQRAISINGYRWFSWEDYAIFDGNGNLKEIQGVGRDITIQKEMEDELEKRVRERTIELKSLISQSPLGILTFNESGFLIDFNSAANNLFDNLNQYLYSNKSYNIFEDSILLKNNYKERLTNLNTSKGLLITGRILIDDKTNLIYKNLSGRYLIYRFYTVEYEDKSKNIVLLLEDVTDLQKTEEVNKRLAEEKIRISTFIKTVESERERISKELHDGIGQLLTSAKLKLDIFRMKCDIDKKEIDEALNILLNAGDEIRRIINDLKPYDIDNFGLLSALELLCDSISNASGLNIQYSANNFSGFNDKKKENMAYRIIQEALNNIVKHSEARTAKLIINGSEKFVNIEISDDGIGCLPETLENKNNRFGILNMKERTNILGGKISFQTSSQKGLKIYLTIPL